MTAEVAIAFIRYMMFTMMSRHEKDYHVPDSMFYEVYDELRERNTVEAMSILYSCVLQLINSCVVKNKQEKALVLFISILPDNIKPFLSFY